MTTQRGYAMDLDQFERDILALITDLRVDERTHPEDASARQAAYESTAKRLGF